MCASWARSSSRAALDSLARNERYLALETRGCRYNLGVKFGVVEAQVALALAGVDRERILALLLESIVRVEQNVTMTPNESTVGSRGVDASSGCFVRMNSRCYLT